ncbi:hypothetical protein MKZ38_002153 [Zalerion maritima]|uniref:Uncharacterized protein n=1 Tax=Zalerion maritima TaxID=339359 RepID=A0AAD5RR34_9PEZI|nr:hypothetical protein MKZ38_002153 [Zalerion maritima]
MLHINTGQTPTQNSCHSQLPLGTSPPHTPASINTNSTVLTDPLSSPNTVTTTAYAKSSPNSQSSSRRNSTDDLSLENTMTSPKAGGGASRLASRLSTFPKRMLRHKHSVSQSNTLSSFPLPPATSSMLRPASQHNTVPDPLPPLPQQLQRPATSSRGPSWRGHKHTKSALGAPTITSAPVVIAEPKAQRPLTYHQPTNVAPFLYAAQSEFMAGPHPGKPYDPFEHRPSPEPPQVKLATDCHEDDPPHVRKTLQSRHWEVLFGEFSWPSASARRSRSWAIGKSKRNDWGGISPRSRSPSCSDRVRDERDNFWVREGEHERGRPRLRAPAWVDKDNGYGPSPDVLQAKELADKLARVRMNR